MDKNTTAFLMGFLCCANVMADETEMQPIGVFLEGESTLDGPGAQFIGLRCHVLLSILSGYSQDNGIPDMVDVFRPASDLALRSAITALESPDKNFLTGQIELMMKGYTQRWLRAKALTGNFSDDAVIKADLPFCMQIFGKSPSDRVAP
jgi:hypothetical protein